jgi:hypothetical protein
LQYPRHGPVIAEPRHLRCNSPTGASHPWRGVHVLCVRAPTPCLLQPALARLPAGNNVAPFGAAFSASPAAGDHSIQLVSLPGHLDALRLPKAVQAVSRTAGARVQRMAGSASKLPTNFYSRTSVAPLFPVFFLRRQPLFVGPFLSIFFSVELLLS